MSRPLWQTFGMFCYSTEFFYRLFKRPRKYNAYITAVSQNVEELLRSDTARLMLANSEFLVMLNQAATDRDDLEKQRKRSGQNVPFERIRRITGYLVGTTDR